MGIRSRGAHVRVNFGQEDFTYNVRNIGEEYFFYTAPEDLGGKRTRQRDLEDYIYYYT